MHVAGIEILVYTGIFLALYFAVFVFLTFFENRKSIYKLPQKANLPRVSLIVPCYNEEENIEKVLFSLANLDYPKENLEIIVVDDGSRDNTLQKALEVQKKDGRVRVFHKENGGKYTALNYGLKRAKGELVGCLDADCYVKEDALRKMLKYFEEKDTAAVVATIKVLRPKKIMEGIQCVEYLIFNFLKKIFSFLGSLMVTSGPLSIFRKEVFDIVGPYKKSYLTEDLEIALRLQSRNLRIVHALEAVVYTKGKPSFKGLFRQRLRWIRGFLLNLKDYPQLLNIKRHGNLSFVLYYCVLGSAIAIVLASYSLWRIGDYLFQKISDAALIGFDLSRSFSLKIDWLWLDFRPLLILSLLSFGTMIGYLLMGKKLTFDTEPLKKKAVFYLITYSFLNAFWWLSALFAILFKKEIHWD